MLDLPWYAYALLSAVFVAAASVLEKDTLKHDDPLHFSGAAIFVAGLISLPLLYFVSWETITISTLLLIYLISILATTAFSLVSYSLKKMEAGEQSVILASTPIVTAVFAYVVLSEALTTNALSGLALVVLGLMLLELPALELDAHNGSFRKKLAPLLLTVLAVFFYSASAIVDRVVLSQTGTTPLDFLIIVQVFGLLNFGILALVRKKKDHLLDGSLRRKPLKIVLFTILLICSRFLYSQAVSMAYVGLTAALKRTGALFTIILSGAFLKEKDLLHKLFAGWVVIMGALLII